MKLKPADKILVIALKKCLYTGRTMWGGCLTPTEWFALYRVGMTPTIDSERVYMESRMKSGIGSPVWCYFYPHKRLKELLEMAKEDTLSKTHK